MSIPKPTLLLWNELLKRSRHQPDFQTFSAQRGITGPHFSEASGWHIYTDLHLPVRISAADSQKDAKIHLELLQTYATLAERAGTEAGIEILEVQGKRLHLFLEALRAIPDDLARILAFGRVLQLLIDIHIRPQVDASRLGFAMAADHGPAIMLLSTLQDQSESLVSLGHAANAPAKKLNRGVPSGHLAFDKNVYDPKSQKADWQTINLEAIGRDHLRQQTELLLAKARTGLERSLVESRAAQLKTFAAEFLPSPARTVQDPLAYQGFMLRADLDGFAARVSRAMAGTNEDKMRLVMEFTAIMQFPAEFKDRLEGKARVLPFPWAGDCANMLLVPEDYEFARTFLPNLAASEWHAQGSLKNRASQPWTDVLAENRWVVGIAGGDNGDADHGYMLVGRVIAYGRGYLVGGGWGWGRSDDAVQAEGTSAEDTVITREDYQGLESSHRAAYRPLGTLFNITSHRTQMKQRNRTLEALAMAQPFTVQTKAAVVTAPAPRPYAV